VGQKKNGGKTSQQINSKKSHKTQPSQKKTEQKKQMGAMGLVIALVVVLTGGVLFVGAVSGWFDDRKVSISPEYYNSEKAGLVDMSKDDYNKMISEKKSFVLFVDQSGCTTADRLKGYVEDWAEEKGVEVGKMMFSEVKELPLYENVKYYPSVVLISHGKPVAWLRADADEDADAYNEYDAFLTWINTYL
jgi:uncharacterized protein YciU (UPF0263 family)